MTPRKKPDATDTEPPDEARPDTAATPLLALEGTSACKFTAGQLLKCIEYMADEHDKPLMLENAWAYVQALLADDVTNGVDLLELPESW